MIRIVIAGTSPFGLPSWQALFDTPAIEVVGVISQPAKPVGRRQVVTPSAVVTWAHDHKLLTLTPVNWRDEAARRQLREWKPDVLVVAAYGLIVPTAVLEIPKHGCLNIHASLLPAYRGASPISAAIVNGDTVTGITFMHMDAGMDTGPTLSQFSCPILPADTTPSLSDRLAALAAEHIVATVKGYVARDLRPKPQPPNSTLAKKITRADGQMTWDSGQRLERMARAYTPWPGLWTTWRKQTLKILAGSFTPQARSEPPGTVVQYENGWGIVCHDGLFLPARVQFEGKQPQPAERILGSYPGWLGSRLGN